MSSQELTPESIPASREQTDEIVRQGARLLSVRGEIYPDPDVFYADRILGHSLPLAIEENLVPLTHSSEVQAVHDAMFVTIGHDGKGNVVPHVVRPAVEVKFMQYRRILHNFWLPSSVCYELDEPSGTLHKSLDATSISIFSSARLEEGIEKSKEADSTLHAALNALQRERDEQMKHMSHDWERHMDTLQARALSEREEQRLGLREVSYSEADIVITYLRQMLAPE